jgi:hypothetical protein
MWVREERRGPRVLISAAKTIVRRKLLLAAVLGAASFASVYAFAATLNVSSQSLGAGNSVVASCVPSTIKLTASYTTAYDSTIPGYRVDKVTLTSSLVAGGAANIPAGCANLAVAVDLAQPAAASYANIADVRTTVPSGISTGTVSSFDVNIPATSAAAAALVLPNSGTGTFPVRASDVGNVSVVISG